nr:DNA-binding domain-containing protein [Parabacteroides goldsteinii]
MADTKTNYVWSYDLVENTMTKDVKEDYVAAIQTKKSMTLSDVAAAISAERTEYRVDTITNIGTLIDEKIRQLVCDGYTVVTGSAQYAPSLGGVFIGDTGLIDPAVNKCAVNIAPSLAMRTEVAKVQPKFSGTVRRMGGARISLVKDVATGKTDGTITPGGMLDVTGTKIRCTGADGTGLGSVQLQKLADHSAAATFTQLGINDPSRLMFTLPADLADGEYQLVVETWFSTTSTLLKEKRTLVYPLTLVVGGSSGGGDDDRPVIE